MRGGAGLVAASLLLASGVPLVGCSSSGDTQNASCSPQPGTYRIHYTPEGDSGCPPIADTTVTISGSDAIGTAMPTPANASCTTSTTGCSFQSKCTVTDPSVTVTTDLAETFTSSGGSGTESTTVTANGQTTMCTYGFTFAKL